MVNGIKSAPEFRRVQQQRGKKGSFYSFYVNIPNSLVDKLQITKGSVVKVSEGNRKRNPYIKIEKLEVEPIDE
jgi:hypothetical protein